MKTVGTKLEDSDYDIFEFCCNDLGLTKSEMLRDLVKTFVNRTNEDIEKDSYDGGKTWFNVKPIPELMNVTVES